ncbi:MAG: N-acetyltransferase family protein [Clostridia bacterium]
MSVALPIAGDYPAHLERECATRAGRPVLIRPVKPGDLAAEAEFFGKLSPESRYKRFQQVTVPPDATHVYTYTHVDYKLHMAFVCEPLDARGTIVGDARYFANPDGSCEFGIAVADDWHHTGVAQLLMYALIAAAREHGMTSMASTVLAANKDMLGFAAELGFAAWATPEDARIVRIELPL